MNAHASERERCVRTRREGARHIGELAREVVDETRLIRECNKLIAFAEGEALGEASLGDLQTAQIGIIVAMDALPSRIATNDRLERLMDALGAVEKEAGRRQAITAADWRDKARIALRIVTHDEGPNLVWSELLGTAGPLVQQVLQRQAFEDTADSELLRLGDQLRLTWDAEKHIGAACELSPTLDAGKQRDAAYEECSRIARKIAELPAKTLAGLRVKAFAVSWCFGEDPITAEELGDGQTSTDIRIAASIINDLLETGHASADEAERAVPDDPVVGQTARWVHALDAYRAEADKTPTRAREEELSDEIDAARRAFTDQQPIAASAAGAAAALRCLVLYNDSADPVRLDGADRALINAALGFLEADGGPAADKMNGNNFSSALSSEGAAKDVFLSTLRVFENVRADFNKEDDPGLSDVLREVVNSAWDMVEKAGPPTTAQGAIAALKSAGELVKVDDVEADFLIAGAIAYLRRAA